MSADGAGGDLDVEVGGDGVCRITLDRPTAKHALTVAMRDGIVDAIRAGRADPAVRAFLIRSTGDAFCAGMDLSASTVSQAGTLRSLAVEIEVDPLAGDGSALAAKVSQRLREALGLSVSVTVADAGTLPRFEMKARRFVVEA